MTDAERIERDKAIIASSSFESSGHSILYSGQDNHDRALNAAATDGAIPIDLTDGGRQLGSPDRYVEYDDATKADDINREASAKYADNLSGDVDTYVVGAREDRIFRETEFSKTLENGKVDSINEVPREDLKGLYDKDPEAAFNKVCEAELERDRTAAQESGDSAALNDVANREQVYQQQLESQGRTRETATEPRQSQEENQEESKAAQTVDSVDQMETDRETVEEAPQPEDLEQPEELEESEAVEEVPQVVDEPEAQEVSEDQDWKHDLGEGIADRNQTETPEAKAQGQEAAETAPTAEAPEAQEAAPSWQSDLGEGIADREAPAASESASASTESESMSM